MTKTVCGVLASIVICPTIITAGATAQPLPGASAFVPPSAQQAPEGDVMLEVMIDGEPRLIDLRPSNIRRDGFKLLMGVNTGDFTNDRGRVMPVDPAPSGVYRGTTDLGELVAADRDETGWNIFISARGVYRVDDTAGRRAGPPPVATLVESMSNGLPAGAVCGADDLDAPVHRFVGEAVDRANLPERASAAATDLRPGEYRVVELGIDCDLYFYERHASSIDLALAEVERVINAVNLVYERDVNISFRLTGVVVRVSINDDPYIIDRPLQRAIRVMEDVWQSGDIDIPHDIGHLFVGRNFNGPAIAVGVTTSVCTPRAYGATQVVYDFVENFKLVSHEFAHNFSAPHCMGDECYIMCYSLNACAGIGDPHFGESTKEYIRNFTATLDCLDIEGGPSCPADIGEPQGVLDIADVVAFLTAFGQGDPIADLGAPQGVFDIADVVAFTSFFGQGCP